MTQEDLRKRLKRHNAFQLGVGLFLLTGSLGFWVASFWIFRVLFAIPLDAFDLPAWEISFYPALGALALLAVEGFRYGKPMYDLAEYARSGYYDNFVMQSETGRALRYRYDDPMGVAFLISHFLFCAPRCTAHAIKAFRSVIRVDERAVVSATRILEELRQSRKWVSASTCADSGTALILLDQLDLIWVRTDSGGVEIRYPPGAD